ncbi:alpha/beta hydrolase-fold protein [uncultured Flavobacterium sp.]|uniref:alpha/beta hydrolase n=1 Tax=uncultured Flavobacterium sp. TaxID=165435 RepID=UPI0030EE6585|tara:strand:+ start:42554 stop:43369 length:816 start_codon:yes stop_codon:yes gene_type:complete
MKKIFFYLLIATLTLSCKKEAVTYNDPIPKHDSLKIASKFVNEDRIINVWTPPMYEQSNDSLPVLYMPDGGIKEDFPHIANTLAELIAAKKIPPFILVGIENTDRKIDLTGPSKIEYDLEYIPNPGGADNFRNFIKNELMPTINKKYRTNNKKAIIGESLAGLFVVETFILDNQMFDYYIAMDPSLWFNEHYLAKNFDELTKDKNYKDKKIWFAGSDAEDINKYTQTLEQKLKNKKENFLWNYSNEPSEQHNTIFRATKEKALIWTLNNND